MGVSGQEWGLRAGSLRAGSLRAGSGVRLMVAMYCVLPQPPPSSALPWPPPCLLPSSCPGPASCPHPAHALPPSLSTGVDAVRDVPAAPAVGRGGRAQGAAARTQEPAQAQAYGHTRVDARMCAAGRRQGLTPRQGWDDGRRGRTDIKAICKFAQMEFKFGEVERGRTIFEGIVANYPKRTDLWSIYLDLEERVGDVAVLRSVPSLCLTAGLSAHDPPFPADMLHRSCLVCCMWRAR